MSTKSTYVPFMVKDISLADWGRKEIMVTFPTIETMNYFKTLQIVDERKISLLYDPIISTKEITKNLALVSLKSKNLGTKIFF